MDGGPPADQRTESRGESHTTDEPTERTADRPTPDDSPSDAMVELAGVTVAYDDVTALADVDLRVEPGAFVTIIGPSGCGKTTLLRTVGGLQEPTSGTVRIDGDTPVAAREAAAVGFVFQRHTLFPWQSALENVTFLRRLAGKPPERERARERLAAVGLAGQAEASPATLSGGMAQRVAIARALHLGADLLLMDEPFGELDELTREEMGVEVRRVWREHDRTVLFVTHSVPEAVLLADRCVVMTGPPGRVAAVFDVDLPRPRDESVLATEGFQTQVADVRRALYEGFDGDR